MTSKSKNKIRETLERTLEAYANGKPEVIEYSMRKPAGNDERKVPAARRDDPVKSGKVFIFGREGVSESGVAVGRGENPAVDCPVISAEF